MSIMFRRLMLLSICEKLCDWSGNFIGLNMGLCLLARLFCKGLVV